jgi:hypothetical protein
VEEADVLEAERQYSQYALESIIVENGVTVEALERILYEFVGCKSDLRREDVESCIFKANARTPSSDKIVNHLCTLGFLGIEVRENDFRFAEDPQEYKKNIVLARKLSGELRRGMRYRINPAFWAYLEINT